ncbi:retromer subunit VPS29 NDAI_0F01050 [Naumovozyma dairenensis CBS 421]|uniref:Vacuolar protein sorting-associated protein 29 n=1 Tax=Naumovozyma dairenensis (strain ATCC 10597 / BCRC 20456 / CBS 421 / NBRC 0211 / NRRL Y-12639) TaxID=1071378 RepID=G0WCB3_NAUDC|nr:hypothetical protein NDAI_0F01050 [Naumovozyma dairenensis CBS 421]CCD25424.1 hypothetical protein NDAI_0F01050 [Naumovozyma dairenensis CBS 421]
MLLLTLSDAHIPDRSIDLPAKFKKLLSVPDKISQVILLGNCTRSSEFLNFVNQISPNVTIIRGEFDTAFPPIMASSKRANEKVRKDEIPINTIIRQGDFKIGCCSGYTIVPKNDPLSLLTLARQLDVDIMLWGGTHNVEAYTLEGKFFVNPGSCTGAFNTDWPVMGDLSDIDVSEKVDSKREEVMAVDKHALSKNDEKQEVGKAATDRTSEANNSDGVGKVLDDTEGNATNDKNNTKEEEPEITERDIDLSEFDINGSNVPSFCLLDIQGSVCTLYIYIFVNGDVKVDKVVYKKE